MTLPNFIIIGAARSGTSAMTTFLRAHPDVRMPYKEPNYFSGWENRLKFAGPCYPPSHPPPPADFSTLDTYKALFAGTGEAQARGEASVSYLIDAATPERIAKTLPEVRLITLLRQPAERSYAHFLHSRMEGIEPCSDFLATLRQDYERRKNNWHPKLSYVSGSHYAEPMARYFKYFARDRIRIHLYEDWNETPLVVWQDIMTYLDIDTGFVPDFSRRVNVSRLENTSGKRGQLIRKVTRKLVPASLRGTIRKLVEPGAPPPAKLDPGVRDELTERYFREDILRLQEMLGRDLRCWLS